MKIPVTNNTAQTMFVGGVMIPAGETRECEEHTVPEHLRPQAPEVVAEDLPPDPLADLLGHSVKALAEMLTGIDDETLDALEAAELGAEKPRKSLLELLQTERLARAEKKAAGDPAGGGE